MERVIICIHGLKNKPSATVLRDWCLLSIHNGLSALGLPQIPFRFELLYWADLFYPKPLNIEITDSKNPLYIANPYKKISSPTQQKINLRKLRSLRRLEHIEDHLFQNDRILQSAEDITDRFIKYKFSDLDGYLRNKTGFGDARHRPTRDVILERLGNLLLKHKNKRIMILAHSMGSIIAYDMLSQPNAQFKIDSLITLGSPLGQPTLMDKFSADNPVLVKIKTPDSVNKWFNFADLGDVIAIDPTLADDYAPNSAGISPEDIFVDNRYTWEGAKNPHALFGYLQTAAVSRRIYDFLIKDRPKIIQTLLHISAWFYSTVLKIPQKRLRKSPSRPESEKKREEARSASQEFEHQVKT